MDQATALQLEWQEEAGDYRFQLTACQEEALDRLVSEMVAVVQVQGKFPDTCILFWSDLGSAWGGRLVAALKKAGIRALVMEEEPQPETADSSWLANYRLVER